MSRVPVGRMSYAEYLAAEAKSDVRHEFLDGEVFAMAGGTPEHGALAIAIASELRNALRGKPCRVYSSDVRVRVEATGLTAYPDASVVCGQLEARPGEPLELQLGRRRARRARALREPAGGLGCVTAMPTSAR